MTLRAMFTGTRKWILSTLILLLIAALSFLVFTRSTQPSGKPTHGQFGNQRKLVDEGPLETAKNLATLAGTAEEQQLALEAERIADQEVDLAFASALRQAQDTPPPTSPELKQLRDHIQALETRLSVLQQQASLLSKAAEGGANGQSQRDLEFIQARVTLVQDSLEDAQQDLIRAGGDREAQIKQELEEHESLQHLQKANTEPKSASFPIQANLLGEVRQVLRLRENRRRLLDAQQNSNAAAQSLTRKHEILEKGLPDTLDSVGDETNNSVSSDDAQRAAALGNLQKLSGKTKTLAEYDRRIRAEQQLAAIYGLWADIVQSQVRAAMHAALRSLLWILLALIGIVVTEGIIERFYTSLGADRRRLGTMRMVLRSVSQVIGVLVILLVLFGPPTQLSTVLALMGAGITVALKDFIVAFFGWFVLIGRQGIRRGDWVEINGIGGEVIEVDLLRTILLETGNWNDAGHPTGRRVSFVNSFAIEGHYFNFTTSGQWLWDELDILIPAGEDPYELTNSVLKLVSDETADSAKLAEQEWRNAVSASATQTFSASPAINVRPTNLGVNLVVRYVVNAHNRYTLRTRLNQAIVQFLHQKRVGLSAAPVVDSPMQLQSQGSGGQTNSEFAEKR